jgi:hypothetical protein
LRAGFPLDVEDHLSHDDLQALVAGLAGVALERLEILGGQPEHARHTVHTSPTRTIIQATTSRRCGLRSR